VSDHKNGPVRVTKVDPAKLRGVSTLAEVKAILADAKKRG